MGGERDFLEGEGHGDKQRAGNVWFGWALVCVAHRDGMDEARGGWE